MWFEGKKRFFNCCLFLFHIFLFHNMRLGGRTVLSSLEPLEMYVILSGTVRILYQGLFLPLDLGNIFKQLILR